MLSRVVIAFLSRSKYLNFMATVTIHSDFGAQENKICHCFHFFPIYSPWSDGTGCHDFHFWMLSFKLTFSLSSFTFIKRLFRSSLFSAIRVVSSTYQRLLIFLPAVFKVLCLLVLICCSSSGKLIGDINLSLSLFFCSETRREKSTLHMTRHAGALRERVTYS